MEPGTRLSLDIDKPAVGGRMLARHDGRVVLVWGAIPGEQVRARIDRVGGGVAYATTEEVLRRSPDRRASPPDWRCGGSVFAHIAYPRQLELKSEIIRDAFARIARMPLREAPALMPSPETGYRMRARLHAHEGRIGFYREGTHALCDAAATGQLAPGACAWIAEAEGVIVRERLTGIASVELAENVAGDVRAVHLDLHPGSEVRRCGALARGLAGLSAARPDRAGVTRLAGDPVIAETLHARPDDPSSAFRLRRDVRSFFQGNRFLLEALVAHVVGEAGGGPVVDLYAGVGLFGIALAAAGAEAVTLVEGDPVSGADLEANAAAFAGRVRVTRRRVEAFLANATAAAGTYIVDPPRSGLSKEARHGVVRLRPPRLVYVSCDVATLARDVRALVDAGYAPARVDAFDLFPGTAHVETVAVLVRP